MQQRQDDGRTLREHLEGISARKGQNHPDLIGPDFPVAGLYLWGWFQEIALGRTGTGFGPAPLSAQEIKAWSDLTQIRITPWEFGVIRTLDSRFVHIVSNTSNPPSPA